MQLGIVIQTFFKLLLTLWVCQISNRLLILCGNTKDMPMRLKNSSQHCLENLQCKNRASELRHLRLVSCYDISPGGLAAVAKKFPLLEELHIYFSLISKVDIEAVGRSCSLLKSFTLNDSGFRGFGSSEFIFSDQALAIAGNMPELRHLALFGSVLTNEGLCTILDGCPRLESLDLRHCYNIDLEGDLGRRCREQIIDLKCPLDSTAGYEFCAQICDYCTSDDEYPFGLSEVDLGLSDYYYDYDYDDFDYDDFTNPFSSEYFDEDGFF